MMRNPIFDALKGLTMALVIYGHFIQRTMMMAGENFFDHPVFKIIYTFHMPLFFFISGYLVAFSLNRKNILDVFKARCQSLLLPYVVWGTLGAVALYMFGGAGKSNFLPIWGQQLIVHPQIWFLWTLFFCSALLLLCVSLQRYTGPWIFLVIWCLMLMVPNKQSYDFFYIVWFFPFYAAGYLFNGAALIAKLNKRSVLIFCWVVFAALASFWSYSDYIYNNRMLDVTVLQMAYRYAIGFLGIACAFFVGNYLIKKQFGRVWEFVGGYSLEIYLLQCLLVEGLFQRIWPKTGIALDANSLVFLFVIAPLLTFLTIAFCIAMTKWLIRSSPATNMVLLGRRAKT